MSRRALSLLYLLCALAVIWAAWVVVMKGL